MPDQQRTFFEQLPYVMAGSFDRDGWPWASMLVVCPGFITSPDATHLTIGGGQIKGDPFWNNVRDNPAVGFVGVELSTRKRNRMNGVVVSSSDALNIEVVQSFGNCPQYIHTRDLRETRDPDLAFDSEVEHFSRLDGHTTGMISRADVFFVASHNPNDDVRDAGGVDASRRGGKPGFVKAEGNTLTIPDYIGNFAFNTFGNFLVNPKAGSLFVGFETGDLLQLTGTVDLQWDGTPETEAFQGAEPPGNSMSIMATSYGRLHHFVGTCESNHRMPH